MNANAISALFEERQNAVSELRSMADAANGRDFTAEELQSEERMNKAIDALDAKIKNGLATLERERQADEARSKFEGFRAAPVEEKRAEADDNTILRQMLAGERRSHEFRDLTKGSATAGGNTLQTTLWGQLFENIRDLSTIMSTNVTVLRTDGGENITVPTVTAYSAASLVGEGAAIPESDPAFGTASLGAYKYGFIVQASYELLQDSNFDIAGFLARQGAVGLANGFNAHLVTGTGTAQPQGITNATVGVTAASATAVTTDELINLYHSVQSQYRNNATWLMRDATLATIRKLKDTTNQYLWSPGLTAGTPDTLLGRPVLTDPTMPAAAINAITAVFGDFSGYWVRLVGGVRVDRSDDFAFANDLASFRFLLRGDGKIIDSVGIRTLKQAAA